MKKTLLAAIVSTIALSGCTTPDVKITPFPKIDESLCRYEQVENPSSYSLFYSIQTPENKRFYASHSFSSEGKGVSQSSTNTPYISNAKYILETNEYKKEFSSLDTGMFLTSEVNDEKTGIDLDIEYSEIIKFTKVGEGDALSEIPTTRHLNFKKQLDWNTPYYFDLNLAKEFRETHQYFSSAEGIDLDSPYKVRVIACTIK